MNPNLRLAQTFVNELAQSGVRHVCISPGSRSTPLTLAFYNHPDIQKHMLFDERSAGFFALGLALSTGSPVPLVCTSGSAAANYFPAIVEARMSHIPLLVLTADRPHELRGSGANQTIDQVKLYGGMVLLSVDLPQPEVNPDPLVERHIRTLAARALAAADGFEKGPVHLNFPFRKPLEPASPSDLPPAGSTNDLPMTRITRGVIAPTPVQLSEFADAVKANPRGLIICGPQSVHARGFPEAIHALSQASGYPILADPLSGLRFDLAEPSPWLVGAYDALLSARSQSCPAPDLVLRFGAVPTSAALAVFLEQAAPRQFLIDLGGTWADDTHRLGGLLQVDPLLFAHQLAAELSVVNGPQLPAPGFEYARAWQQLEQTAWEVLTWHLQQVSLFDAAAVYETLRVLPAEALLFVGNSLAIRHFDRVAAPRPTGWKVWGTRGASGIDGNLSTALGIAASEPQQPLVVFLGDLALLHDLNALHIPRRLGLPNVTIVVNNNHGGGIFHRLPIQAFDPPFTEAFLTPHDLAFEHAAAMFGLDYTVAGDLPGLRAALDKRFSAPPDRAALIEVPTDSAADVQANRQLLQALALRLGG